uniref:Uncharacterized protein n=1 Tax=Anguilla anguilla TaxID=7936 RepID=A0A0E9T551_ANGAN
MYTSNLLDTSKTIVSSSLSLTEVLRS